MHALDCKGFFLSWSVAFSPWKKMLCLSYSDFTKYFLLIEENVDMLDFYWNVVIYQELSNLNTYSIKILDRWEVRYSVTEFSSHCPYHQTINKMSFRLISYQTLLGIILYKNTSLLTNLNSWSQKTVSSSFPS